MAVGDELFKRKCYAKMEEFFDGGGTILYVSHSIPSINEFCTRAIFLDSGELIIEDIPKLTTSYYQKYILLGENDKKKFRESLMSGELPGNDAELGQEMDEGDDDETHDINNCDIDTPYFDQNHISKSSITTKKP